MNRRETASAKHREAVDALRFTDAEIAKTEAGLAKARIALELKEARHAEDPGDENLAGEAQLAERTLKTFKLKLANLIESRGRQVSLADSLDRAERSAAVREVEAKATALEAAISELFSAPVTTALPLLLERDALQAEMASHKLSLGESMDQFSIQWTGFSLNAFGGSLISDPPSAGEVLRRAAKSSWASTKLRDLLPDDLKAQLVAPRPATQRSGLIARAQAAAQAAAQKPKQPSAKGFSIAAGTTPPRSTEPTGRAPRIEAPPRSKDGPGSPGAPS